VHDLGKAVSDFKRDYDDIPFIHDDYLRVSSAVAMLGQRCSQRRWQPLRHQRRSFMGLQRTPPPKTSTMGYLVLQGLALVLLADYGFASLLDHPTVIKKVAQSTGMWQEGSSFKDAHTMEGDSG